MFRFLLPVLAPCLGFISGWRHHKLIAKHTKDQLLLPSSTNCWTTFLQENIIMINTCACMFSTVITQKEVDKLTDALLNGFRFIKPKLEELYGQNISFP